MITAYGVMASLNEQGFVVRDCMKNDDNTYTALMLREGSFNLKHVPQVLVFGWETEGDEHCLVNFFWYNEEREETIQIVDVEQD